MAFTEFPRQLRVAPFFGQPSHRPEKRALRLARKIGTDAGRRTCQIELNERAIDRAAARMSAADLSLNDLAEVVPDAIKSSERRILEHVRRMFKLIDVKSGDQHEKARISNIHRRLTQVESELRNGQQKFKWNGRVTTEAMVQLKSDLDRSRDTLFAVDEQLPDLASAIALLAHHMQALGDTMARQMTYRSSSIVNGRRLNPRRICGSAHTNTGPIHDLRSFPAIWWFDHPVEVVLKARHARTSAAELSVQDIAVVVSDIIRDYKKEIPRTRLASS